MNVPNASTTTYRRGVAGVPVLVDYASSTAVEAAGSQATHEPDHAGSGSGS